LCLSRFHNIVEDAVKTLGILLEFIGPAGVGKSTLRSSALARHWANWVFPPEDKHQQASLYSDSAHYDLILMKAARLASRRNLNSLQQTTLLNYHTKIVMQDLTLAQRDSHLNVVLDEGLIHNFAAELSILPRSTFTNLVTMRALIYLRPDQPETVVKRLLDRAAAGHVLTHHQGLSDTELLSLKIESVSYLDQVTDRLAEIGLPILKLVAELPLTVCVDKCIDFVETLLGPVRDIN